MEALKGSNAVERVASAPPAIRAEAMEFAVERRAALPGATLAAADIVALRQYYDRTFKSPRLPERTLRVGSLMGHELGELWTDGVRVIERARDHIENRMGYAWAAHLSSFSRTAEVTGHYVVHQIRPNLIRDVIFPALEQGDGAEAELMKRLNNPAHARQMTLRHRQHIIEGVRMFVRFMKLASNTHQFDQNIQQLIAAWRVPPSVYPADTWALGARDARTGEVYMRGMKKFEERLARIPTLQDRLSAPEKIVYIQYLGSWRTGRTIMRLPLRLGNRSLKMVLRKVREEEQRAGVPTTEQTPEEPETDEPAQSVQPEPAPRQPEALPPPRRDQYDDMSDAEVDAELRRRGLLK